ncbi:MAG: hypothetical protein GY839_19840 [candidate division Zixibacteria bacterium]|nr:hypothetical protein [candidate division Zixibacteria bacterium]
MPEKKLRKKGELSQEIGKKEAAVTAKEEIRALTKDRMAATESIIKSLVAVYPEFGDLVSPGDIAGMFGVDIGQLAGCGYCEKCFGCQSCNSCEGCYSCETCQNCNTCQKHCESCQTSNITGNFLDARILVMRDQLQWLIRDLSKYY